MTSWSRTALLALLTLLLAPAAAAGQASALPTDSVVSRAVQSRFRGEESAPVLVYLFSDFQCPFCREFETTTLPAIDSAYVRTGKARIVFFNFPLETHPNAWAASEAALCAGAQGKFWPMHDRLFAEQRAWASADTPGPVLEGYARDLALDLNAFRTCTRDDQVWRVLAQDLALGTRGGVSGTPTIVLLREPRPGEPPQDAQRVLSGAVPFEQFRKEMEELVK